MADSLKTGTGAVYRERRHSSARREFSQWFTADWRLLTEGGNKINAAHVGMVGGAAVKRSENAQCEGLSSPVGRG